MFFRRLAYVYDSEYDSEVYRRQMVSTKKQIVMKIIRVVYLGSSLDYFSKSVVCSRFTKFSNLFEEGLEQDAFVLFNGEESADAFLLVQALQVARNDADCFRSLEFGI